MNYKKYKKKRVIRKKTLDQNLNHKSNFEKLIEQAAKYNPKAK